MKTLILSLTAALVATVLTTFFLRHAETSPSSSSPAGVELRGSVSGAPSAGFDFAPPPAAASGQLRWAQLESTDYREYIANLRRVGCPETTLRDIIRADIHALYAQQRAGAAQRSAGRYWEAGFNREPRAESPEAEEALVTVLLGEDSGTGEPRGPRTGTDPGLNLDGLPAEKQAALAEGWRWLETQREALLLGSMGRAFTPAEEQQMEELEREHGRWLRQELSPAQREEFDLRNSPIAERLRGSLLGVAVTEAEFRALFRQRQWLEEQVERAVAGGEGSVTEASEALAQAAAAVLGPERFDRYQQLSDTSYQRFAAAALANGWEWQEIEAAWKSAEAADFEGSEAEDSDLVTAR